jgi:hypothetical protein
MHQKGRTSRNIRAVQQAQSAQRTLCRKNKSLLNPKQHSLLNPKSTSQPLIGYSTSLQHLPVPATRCSPQARKKQLQRSPKSKIEPKLHSPTLT